MILGITLGTILGSTDLAMATHGTPVGTTAVGDSITHGTIAIGAVLTDGTIHTGTMLGAIPPTLMVIGVMVGPTVVAAMVV